MESLIFTKRMGTPMCCDHSPRMPPAPREPLSGAFLTVSGPGGWPQLREKRRRWREMEGVSWSGTREPAGHRGLVSPRPGSDAGGGVPRGRR